MKGLTKLKFTPEVVAALETLKNAAENDFERHRIAVLERDLTSPPTVEVIDDTHQKFNGVVYKTNTHGHYVNSSSIHRAIYSYYFGEIPVGDYEIHHIDENKSNNNPDNLQLLTKAEHHRLHLQTAPMREYVCEYCGKTFYSNSLKPDNRCCSLKCIQSLHYAKNHEIRKCPVCNSEFPVYKHSKTLCCSPSCAAKWYHSNTSNLKEVKCAFCNKIFFTEVSNKKYCSQDCAKKARNIKSNNLKRLKRQLKQSESDKKS